jgi:tripartite-type tricarboxylate transporter receptor subunit TctC
MRTRVCLAVQRLNRSLWLLAGFFFSAAAPVALAQSYPTKPIKLVVGFAVGGVTDLMGRALAQKLSSQLGQPVFVEVRTGADSLLASQMMMRAEPDGYTLYLATTAHAVNQTLFRKAGFDAVNDFTSISLFCDIPNVIAINPTLPVKTLGEFISYAKARKGELNYSTSASGTFLAAEMMNRAAGIALQRIPYKGAAPAMVALMSNEVQMTVTGIGSVVPYLNTNKIKVLAVASPKRSTLAPDIPTASEAGLPNHATSTWYAVLGPPKMSRELQERLNTEVRKALADPDFAATLLKLGAVPQSSSPAELEAFMRSEVEKWKKIIQETNAQED